MRPLNANNISWVSVTKFSVEAKVLCNNEVYLNYFSSGFSKKCWTKATVLWFKRNMGNCSWPNCKGHKSTNKHSTRKAEIDTRFVIHQVPNLPINVFDQTVVTRDIADMEHIVSWLLMMMLDASAEVDTQEQLELEKKPFALASTKHFTFSK